MGGSHAHGAGHGHGHGEVPDVPVSPGPRLVLLVSLGLAALATIGGLVAFWPTTQPHHAQGADAFAAPGATVPHAEVLKVQRPCPNAGGPAANTAGCGQLVARLHTGVDAGQRVTVTVPPDVSQSNLRRGDSVELIRTPTSQGQSASFLFFGVDRNMPISLLAAVFVVVVGVVARVRGLLALVGLAFGAGVLVKFMLPALLTGESGLGVALTGATAIMFVVLYLAHGPSLRTSAALAGTLVGIGFTAVIGLLAVNSQRLSGVTGDSGAVLTSFVGHISFQGLITCAIIIAGLGVLNDVTITQASAVWELRAASPQMGRGELFTSAMRIGRDHIASTIYTIVFAYAGTALTVLMLLFLYNRPFIELLSTEDIAEEVTRTLASAIGLVLAVPITTGIATATVAPRHSRGRRARI